MLGQIVLFELGELRFTLRALLLLLCFSAYAYVCILLSPKRAVRRDKAAWAILCGYAGMLALGRGGYMLLDKNAPREIISAGEIVFLGFVGFFAGIRLYCFKSPKAFRKLLRHFSAPFFALAAAVYLLRDGDAGVLSAHGGLFRYTDVYGMHRWNAPLLQGTMILLLMAVAFGLERFMGMRSKTVENGEKAQKRPFKIKAVPMALAAQSLLMPVELLRDTTQIKLSSAPVEALMIWFVLMAMLLYYLPRRLSGYAMPLKTKILNAASALILPLLSVFALCGGSAALSMLTASIPVFLLLSPLFPFIKRPNRPNASRRRRFN